MTRHSAPPDGTAPAGSVTARLPAPARFVLGVGLLTAFAAMGQALVTALGWPLPGAVVGMALLWAALGVRLVKLHWLLDAADGLLGVLGLLFVPATVGFIQFLSAGAAWGAWLLVMVAGLLVGAGVAGLVASRLARPEESQEDREAPQIDRGDGP